MTAEWFHPLAQVAETLTSEQLSWQPVPPTQEREAAVLILFSEIDGQPCVTIIERPGHMRNHGGQPAFPGGAIDSDDVSATMAALREANEEIGLDPNSVTVIAELPQLWLPPSRFKVTPVLAWWEQPSKLTAPDSEEVSAIHHVSLSELVNPENRVRVMTRSGFLGPAFLVRDMVIWGFTGGVLAQLLDLAGLSVAWDESRIIDVPEAHQVSWTS
jgi:8-oxo-dGTP pyrophosphatase MutT (NUDIX family)